MNSSGKWIASGVIFFYSATALLAEAGSPGYVDKAQRAVKARAKATQQARKEAREKPLREADELIRNGNPAAAYNLLEPLEFDRSGEVRFDYLLALAALDSGKPDKATLAFERVLAVDPDFAGARLDMARAYYQLGDTARAKTEFEVALQQNPPDAARTAIQQYLDAIAEQEAAKQTRITGYVEGALGNDSNVNASTSQTQISIPAFGNLSVALSPINVKVADNYYGMAAGGEVSHNLNSKWGVYAGADLRQRGYVRQRGFDSLGLEGRAGVVFGEGQNRFRAGVSGGQYTLGKARNRHTAGFNAEWSHTFSANDQLTVFGQHNRYRYVDDAMKTNDFNQNILGAGWLHIPADGNSVLFASLYYGTEKDVAPVTLDNPDGGRIDGAKRMYGMRAGGQVSVGEKTELFASVGWQQGTYGRENPLFARRRNDRLYDVTVGANRHQDKLWTIRPQLSYSRNESNIAIYSFDRTDVSVTVRRDFR